MFKRVICFLFAVMVAASSSFAADSSDIPWQTLDVTPTSLFANPVTVDATGSDTSFIVADDGTLSESYVEVASNSYSYPTVNSNPVSFDTPTNRYVSYRPVNTLYATHSELRGNVEHNFSYPLVSVSAHSVIFYTSSYLPAGYYEIIAYGRSFEFFQTSTVTSVIEPSISQLTFTRVLDGTGVNDVLASVALGAYNHTYVYLESNAYVYFYFTYNAYVSDYLIQDSNPVSSRIWYAMDKPVLKYRSVDPADVAALNQANQQAGGTMQDYDSTEQQFTQSMTDNFNALNLSDFTFPSGLLSGFTLVTSLFEQLWSGLGEYKILYVFPLTLGIVLLLIGRISKSSGGQSSRLTDRGDDDA